MKVYCSPVPCGCVLPAGEVVFDRTHPGFPPDIIFSSGDEFMEFEPNIDQLEVCDRALTPITHFCHDEIYSVCVCMSVCDYQVFSEWSLRSPDCLCQLLEGLMVQYREHHKALLSQSHRLHFELQSLLESGVYSEVDVHCSRPEEVSSTVMDPCITASADCFSIVLACLLFLLVIVPVITVYVHTHFLFLLTIRMSQNHWQDSIFLCPLISPLFHLTSLRSENRHIECHIPLNGGIIHARCINIMKVSINFGILSVTLVLIVQRYW